MKNTIIPLVTYFCVFICICPPAYSWSDKTTHPAITDKAVYLSTMDDYLKNQLGIPQGLETEFQTVFYPALEQRMVDLDPERTTRSVLDWIKTGSQLEDKTLKQSRSRHHFHIPIANPGVIPPNPNSGLDNKTDHPEWRDYAPAYYGFDFTGESALNWAIDGTSDKYPTTNLEKWSLIRGHFYNALTYTIKSDRDRNMGMALLSLGSVTHLLEDMGVPAHTRNDFVWGHTVAGFHENTTGAKNPWYKGGHPFEAWTETQIANNGEEIPSVYLARLMETPPAFARFDDYWDTGICAESGIPQWQGDSVGWPTTGFGNSPPEKTWGLSECTNYQFLSLSTVFGCSGVKYQFPNPAKENAPANLIEPAPAGKKVYFNGSNYGPTHLARESYTFYVATGFGYNSYPVIDSTITTDDVLVFEDYADITIPRTIDYATGLINYFFRGRLSVEPNWADPNIEKIC